MVANCKTAIGSVREGINDGVDFVTGTVVSVKAVVLSENLIRADVRMDLIGDD